MVGHTVKTPHKCLPKQASGGQNTSGHRPRLDSASSHHRAIEARTAWLHGPLSHIHPLSVPHVAAAGAVPEGAWAAAEDAVEGRSFLGLYGNDFFNPTTPASMAHRPNAGGCDSSLRFKMEICGVRFAMEF
jgi:hypothetical protein